MPNKATDEGRQVQYLMRFCVAMASVALLAAPPAAWADEPIGQIKTVMGQVTIQRGAPPKPVEAKPGVRVFRSDLIVTQAHASVGITFSDNSLMALGPYSRLGLDQYHFNPTTHEGSFDASLKKGTVAVKSGQIVKQTPEAMRIRTPVAVLGVRGTEFVASADTGGN